MSTDTSTQMDDMSNSGPSEQELLDAVMRNSPLMEEEGIPLPEGETSEEDPVESGQEEDPIPEEVVSEDKEEEVEDSLEEDEGEDAGEEPATQEPDVYTMEDLDLDAKVSLKIDGEEIAVAFSDLIKGYSTEQSLSKKGRELGEARKALEDERTAKLKDLEATVSVANEVMSTAEQTYSKQYHDFEAKIEKAREDGDTFELSELKDKREQAQKRYWAARNKREQMLKQATEQYQTAQQETFQQEIETFMDTIPDYIPDFNEDVAGKIRDFALEKGIPETMLESVTDPAIVKFIDDYRRLEQGVSKGSAKRKAAPTKKVPAKKATPAKKKEADKAKMVKARAFKQDASEQDQMDFLRQYASKSLNL